MVDAYCLHWVFVIFSNVFRLESKFSDTVITIKVSCVDYLNPEKFIELLQKSQWFAFLEEKVNNLC